jgi:hypothetical protein
MSWAAPRPAAEVVSLALVIFDHAEIIVEKGYPAPIT